jgi:hypothetical protein
MLNVHAGRLLKSAFTIAKIPKFANAPRIIPHGKFKSFVAACLEAMSSDEYFSNHLNRKSVNTKTPR